MVKAGAILLCLIILLLPGCFGKSVSISNWPEGRKAALVITFDVEQANSSHIQRVVRALEARDAKATFFVVPGYYEGAEEALQPLKAYEVASKGWRQSEWRLDTEAQRKSIEMAHRKLATQGVAAKGFRAPFLRANQATFEILRELGYAYDSSETGLLPSSRNQLVEVPLSVAYDPFWSEEVEEYLPLFYYAFEKTYEEGGLFSFYTLPEHVDDRWEVFLTYASEKDVWIATAGEVAEWWRRKGLVELAVQDDKAVLTNHGDKPVQGITLRAGDRLIPVPELKAGQTLEVSL